VFVCVCMCACVCLLPVSIRYHRSDAGGVVQWPCLCVCVCVLVCVCVHVCHFSVSQVRHWWDCALAVFMCVFVYVFFQYHR